MSSSNNTTENNQNWGIEILAQDIMIVTKNLSASTKLINLQFYWLILEIDQVINRKLYLVVLFGPQPVVRSRNIEKSQDSWAPLIQHKAVFRPAANFLRD